MHCREMEQYTAYLNAHCSDHPTIRILIYLESIPNGG
jgi:hypothetical protein